MTRNVLFVESDWGEGWVSLGLAALLCVWGPACVFSAEDAGFGAMKTRGRTPFTIAVGNGGRAIVSLLTAQAEPATLHAAANTGDIEALARLMANGANINCIDVQGRTALHAAVRAGQTEAVKWLLAHGADANWLDDRKMAPLAIALRIAQDFSFSNDPNEVARFNALKRKQRGIMTLLVGAGARPGFRYGVPHRTVLAHPAKIVDLLIAAGPNLAVSSDEQATLLHRAAWWGRERVVAELLELGADVHAVDRKGGTPLHAAVHRGSTGYWDVISSPHAGVVKLLLDHGADVKAVNNDGVTALAGAMGRGDPNAAELLIQYGADDETVDEAGRTPLHRAAERGSIEDMTSLIAKGADPNIADNEGNTPLHLLLANRRWVRDDQTSKVTDCVTKLVRGGIPVDAQNQLGVALLHQAVALGSWTLVEDMLSRGARVNAQSADGWTALHSAVAGGYAECVTGLLRHGANVNGYGRLPDMVCLAQHYEPARTPLQIAASGGHDDIIRMLIASDADIEAVDEDGKAALYMAYEQKHPSTFKLLLESGADPNTRTPDGIALTYRVAARKRPQMVDALLGHLHGREGALVQTLAQTGTTPLHTAAKAGDLDRVAELLAGGAGVNISDRQGLRPIHGAYTEGHVEIVKLLLPKTPVSVMTDLLFRETQGHAKEMVALLISHGADAGATDRYRGDSLLHRSAWGGDEEMIEFLLAHGADVNVLDKRAETPLTKAVQNGRRDVVGLLLSHGADVNICAMGRAYNSGCTPLYYALSQDNVPIAEMLVNAGANLDIRPSLGNVTLLQMTLDHRPLFELMLTHGADINARSRGGKTPLHMASESGQVDEVRYLIDRKAAVNVQDNNGNTPLHLAARKGHGPVCAKLVESGADVAIRNERGRLALDYALASGLDNLVDELTPPVDKEVREQDTSGS